MRADMQQDLFHEEQRPHSSRKKMLYTVYSKKVNKKDLYPANSVSGAT